MRSLHLSPTESQSLLGSVRVEESSNCNIFLGPVCTSVYLSDLTNCTIAIACHQLRIHKCHNCKLYVKVSKHEHEHNNIFITIPTLLYKYI